MPYTIEEIKNILGLESQIVSKEAVIRYLLTDSRSIIFPRESLFIAIKGSHHNGHSYLKQAYEAGVRNFIVEQKNFISLPDANFLYADNSVDALQKLAASHRANHQIPVIGITGSNGKTIVKEWIYHLLRSRKNICRSPKSYNSQIGVPLSVWQLEPGHELGIFEAGISQRGEMEKLEKIILPTIGIFTNLGPAHDEGFSDREKKLREKLKLFAGSNLEILIYSCDDVHTDTIIRNTISKEKLLCWSRRENKNASIQVRNIRTVHEKTSFDLYIDEAIYRDIEIPFSDEASLENAVHALIAAQYLQAEEEIVKAELKSLPAISMRLELKRGINNCRIINDVYSADLASLEIALHFLNRQRQNLQTRVILSDIAGSGEDPGILYQKVAQLLIENKIQKFIGIGEIITSYAQLFSERMQSAFFPSTEAFLDAVQTDTFHNEFILIKGARKFRLEQVSNEFSEKTHGTVLQVNLNHLIHNLHVYRGLLQPGVRTMAMVKAFSYGSGTAEIAAALAFHHVDYLAVAYTDEGVELRKNGMHLPVMVMNPEPDTFDHILTYNLEPEIYNFRILRLFIDFIRPLQKEIKIHIKIDTGMHRLGFMENEMEALITMLSSCAELRVASVFSHLAAADDAGENDFTEKQIALFDRLSSKLITQFSYPVMRHILNSPGISKFPKAQFDMVRIGIGLYGDDPAKAISEKLLPVSYIYTAISQIKHIPAGESIGYGRSAYAEKDMQIATLNIGYADGFSRRLGNGKGRVFIGDQEAPVVGRVCMDMIMVDISGIENVKEGDLAEIFGAHITLQQYAERMQTIPYEVLTGISQRVKRVYIQE